jgi:DNA-directed RNA polymerase specialized sigma24 family protein
MEMRVAVTSEKLINVIENDGVEPAFDLLFVCYGADIEKHIYRRLLSWRCVDPIWHKFDVLQETLFAVFKALVKVSEGCYETEFSHPRAWLYSISRSKVSNHIGQRECCELPERMTLALNDDRPLQDISDQGIFAKDLIFLQEKKPLIEHAIKSLPSIFQKAVEDQLMGLDHSEIAKKRNIKVDASKKRKSRSVYKLARKLIELGIDPGIIQ